MEALKSRAVSLIRFEAGVTEWTKKKLQPMDPKIRTFLTMYRAHYRKTKVDRLYMKRSGGE